MHVFADRPPGTLWVPAFVTVAQSFSSWAARGVNAPTRRAEALGLRYKALRAGEPSCKNVHHTRGDPPHVGVLTPRYYEQRSI